MSTVQLTAAAGFALVALAMWWGFLRPVPEIRATGVVEAKVHKPAGEYQRTPVELSRGFRAPTRVPTAEAWIFQVRLDESGELAAVAQNVIAAREFEVGDRVDIAFQRRGFPPLWERVTVIRMESHPS
jgi:hypothetical protein